MGKITAFETETLKENSNRTSVPRHCQGISPLWSTHEGEAQVTERKKRKEKKREKISQSSAGIARKNKTSAGKRGYFIHGILRVLHENADNFRLMSVHHAPLKGSTSFLQRSSTRRTPLRSSQLAELKYSISARQDVRLKNYSPRKSLDLPA